MTDHFASVLAAFRGAKFPLEERGASGLWYALNPPASDLAITPETFHIRVAGHHEMSFPLECAPGIVSFLLERVGISGPRSIKSWLASATIQRPRLTPFTSPPRHILAEAWTTRVMIRLREHEAALDDELPTLSEKRFARYPHACPHCHVVPERYRVLSDHSLVCLACGASSSRPT